MSGLTGRRPILRRDHSKSARSLFVAIGAPLVAAVAIIGCSGEDPMGPPPPDPTAAEAPQERGRNQGRPQVVPDQYIITFRPGANIQAGTVNSLAAQHGMRKLLTGVSFCLMIATTLHSVAVGNLLPAWVDVVCVDINPSTVIKLSDRGSFQTVGLVTDVEPFLRALVDEVRELEKSSA